MMCNVNSPYVVAWYATIDYHQHCMRLKRRQKLILLITEFLAFIIEPWGQNSPGYVALKCLKKKILGGKKERMLGFSYYKR